MGHSVLRQFERWCQLIPAGTKTFFLKKSLFTSIICAIEYYKKKYTLFPLNIMSLPRSLVCTWGSCAGQNNMWSHLLLVQFHPPRRTQFLLVVWIIVKPPPTVAKKSQSGHRLPYSRQEFSVEPLSCFFRPLLLFNWMTKHLKLSDAVKKIRGKNVWNIGHCCLCCFFMFGSYLFLLYIAERLTSKTLQS